MSTIDVYQADHYGFFLYTSTANELPLAPGTYNIPYGAYTDAPPPASDGMVARRVGDAWEVVEDHRRDTLYVVRSAEDGELNELSPYTIGAMVRIDGQDVNYDGGGPIPSWLTDAPPAPPVQDGSNQLPAS